MKTSRTTIAKTAILELIENADKALAHADIQNEIGELCNRVTIYRVLDRLIEEERIHKVLDTDGVAKFLACNACEAEHDHHHLHFSCKKCGSVTCLHHVVPNFKLPKNYLLEEVNFTVSGICPNCQGSNSPS